MALIAHLIVIDNEGKPVKIDIPFMPVSPKIRNEYRKMMTEHHDKALQIDEEWQIKLDAVTDGDIAALVETRSEYRDVVYQLTNNNHIELLKKAMNLYGQDKALLAQIRKPVDEWWQDVDSYSIREAVDSFRAAYGLGG
jgi:hypothetical protein